MDIFINNSSRLRFSWWCGSDKKIIMGELQQKVARSVSKPKYIHTAVEAFKNEQCFKIYHWWYRPDQCPSSHLLSKSSLKMRYPCGDGKAKVWSAVSGVVGNREIWESQACYSSPAEGLSYRGKRKVLSLYPFPYLTKFFTLLWRFYLLFTVIAKGPLKWQEVRETAVEVVKKKIKRGFYTEHEWKWKEPCFAQTSLSLQ